MSATVAELLKDKARQAPDNKLYSVGPDVSVSDAVNMMVKNTISSVVVMDNHAMVGLITLRELLQGLYQHSEKLTQAKCRDVMKTNPPVMNQEALVGILSFHDIARSAIKDADFENKLLKQYIRNWPE